MQCIELKWNVKFHRDGKFECVLMYYTFGKGTKKMSSIICFNFMMTGSLTGRNRTREFKYIGNYHFKRNVVHLSILSHNEKSTVFNDYKHVLSKGFTYVKHDKKYEPAPQIVLNEQIHNKDVVLFRDTLFDDSEVAQWL